MEAARFVVLRFNDPADYPHKLLASAAMNPIHFMARRRTVGKELWVPKSDHDDRS